MDEYNKSNSGEKRTPDGRFAKGTYPKNAFDFGNDMSLKYTPDIPARMVEWFMTQAEESNRYPTFERFAHSIGVLHATLRHWRDNPERYGGFSNAYDVCKEIQASVLNENALAKLYDSNYAKFVATNTLGMVEQSSLTVQGNEEKPLAVSIEIVG